MKRSSDYNDLLLKTFIRESFVQHKKEDLFKRKKNVISENKKRLIKEQKVVNEVLMLIENFENSIDNIILESSRRYSIKDILLEKKYYPNPERRELSFSTDMYKHEDPLSFDFTQETKKLEKLWAQHVEEYKRDKINPYIMPGTTTKLDPEAAKEYFIHSHREKPEGRTVMQWMRDNKTLIYRLLFLPMCLSKLGVHQGNLMHKLGGGEKLDPEVVKLLEPVMKTAPGGKVEIDKTELKKVTGANDQEVEKIVKEIEETSDKIQEKAEEEPKAKKSVVEKIKQKAKKVAKKVKEKVKKAKEKVKKAEQQPQQPQQQPEQPQQQQAPEKSLENQYKEDMSDDKATNDLVKQAEKKAKKYGDVQISDEEQETSQEDMQQIEDTTSSNVQKANRFMRASSQHEQNKDLANDYWDSLKDQEREDFAGKIDKVVRALMQDEIRSGKIGDALEKASEEAGENKGKIKRRSVTSNEGGIDQDSFTGDLKVIATDKASDFQTKNNSQVDLKDWGSGLVDDLGDELADEVVSQYNSPDVKPHLVDAFKKAGIKNAEDVFDRMIDRVANKAKLVFQGMVHNKAKGRSSGSFDTAKPIIDPQGKFGITSATATK